MKIKKMAGIKYVELEVIQARCHAQLTQIDKIKEMRRELHNIKTSEYYTTFSNEHDRKLDVAVLEAKIRHEELLLMGLLENHGTE